MKKPASSDVFFFSLALAMGAALMAAVIGTGAFAIPFAVVAVASTGVALTRRRDRTSASAFVRRSSWKKFVASGGLLLAALIVLINLPANKDQELSPVAWSALMLSILVSLSLIGAGAVLGVLTVNRKNRH